MTVATLALDDLVVYLAFHASKHDWERLEWLSSFHAVASRDETDWDAVARRPSCRISQIATAW